MENEIGAAALNRSFTVTSDPRRYIGKTENAQTGWEYNTFKKKQICDFSQLDKNTENVYSYYARVFLSISILYDGALAPVLTRH